MIFPSAQRAEGEVIHPARPPGCLYLHICSAFICCWLFFWVGAAFPYFPGGNFWMQGRHCSICGSEQLLDPVGDTLVALPEGLFTSTPVCWGQAGGDLGPQYYVTK